MWGDVLGLALFTSLNPMLLAFILLVISRPRPVPNLLAFWVGCVIVNLPAWLLPLMALHLVPSFESFAQGLATPAPGSGIQPLQLGTGVFCLLVAVWMTVRLLGRQRVNQPVPAGTGGDPSTLVTDADTPALTTVDTQDTGSPPRGRVRGAAANVRSAIRRLVGRAQDAWENGAVWVSLVVGLMYVPPPPLVLLVTTIIVGSGAAIGTQVIAVLVFIIVMLGVFEIALISYVVAPARTEAILQPVHDWAGAHRMQILLALFAVVGVWQVATGTGIL